ncbi:TRAP transporter substrate-binding protein [Variovorax sp. ZS18.2.2]|uniref:TRAP transporter substrate-binding protein n=1 Tax=Variovorax sp. ZS18.2.2 TaxID=2971255 RepID=UPI002150FEAA|nr:TRAP transporter substrate-binding protein [Variovorax sp. ZS18.2.2]MCR6480881.1 TRAP transporter substrate-binding protein [Variovorax sp. ZS18.2.2]
MTSMLVTSMAGAQPANSAGNSGGGSDGVTWVAGSEYPATTMPGVGLDTFGKRLAEHSKGALQIKPHYDHPLGAIAMLGAVTAGEVQVGDVHGGPLGEVEPVFNLVSLPFVTSSATDTRCLQSVTRQTYASAFEAKGVHLLYSTPWPATGLWSAWAVDTMSDLKRLRVRTYDATSAALMGSLGVYAVNVPFGEAMPRIKSGDITAVMSSGDGGAGRRLWEHLPHFTDLNYAAPLSFTVVNKTAYDKLPQALKSAVDRAAADTETALWDVMRDRAQANRRAMASNGVIVHAVAAPEIRRELQEAGGSVIENWKTQAGPAGAAMLADYERARKTAGESSSLCKN